jgi:hypothetical protein
VTVPPDFALELPELLLELFDELPQAERANASPTAAPKPATERTFLTIVLL